MNDPGAWPRYYANGNYRQLRWQAALLGCAGRLIPRDWLARTLGHRRFSGTVLGALIALPGMMCTCCAAPVAAGMRRQSVSSGAALAFGSPTRY